jgi:CubicO group peptidase (beta-lactamase class C family)
MVDSLARAIPEGLNGTTTDPQALGIMVGSPPPPDKQVRFADFSFMAYPNMRWSLNHRRELCPTVAVTRGTGPVRPLPVTAGVGIGELNLTSLDGAQMTVEDALDATFADGFLVLQHGAIVYEKYFGAGAPDRPHMAFSITKSLTAIVALQLVDAGLLELDRLVGSYLPELADSAYGDAAVRDVLDMTVGVHFVEDYADFSSEVVRYGEATGLTPVMEPSAGDSHNGIADFLASLIKEGAHGAAHHYVSPNADVLAWLIGTVTGRSLAEEFADTIYSKIGAERDAYFDVDRIGTPIAGTGLSLTLRDLGRIGELLRLGGRIGDEQIIAAETMNQITDSGGARTQELFAEMTRQTGMRQHLTGWSYRNMFFHPNDADGAFVGRGIFGQTLYVNSRAGIVIARYSSSPVAANNDEDAITVPMIDAIVAHMGTRPA